MNDKILFSAKRVTIIILGFFAGFNAVWAVASQYSGPLMGSIFYGVIFFFCWRKNHFQAGVIGGICGLAIHICELIFQDIAKLGGIYTGFFFVNLILPIPPIYFIYMAQKG